MQDKRTQVGKKVAWIALVANIILAAGKIIIGYFGGSEAVFADGIHSGADVVASIAVVAVVGISNKPPDEEHPFGHGKAEVISESIVGLILFFVSIYIIVEAVFAMLGTPSAPDLIAMAAALGSYFAKEILYRYSMKRGKKFNSKAIMAIAYDHQADIVASLAAFAGVLLSIVGHYTGWKILLYGDAAASIIVAGLIFRISAKLVRSSVNVLMEKNVDHKQLEKYTSAIESFADVKRIDQIRARELGHYVMLDVRLSIDHDKTIKEGHDTARKIKNEIQDKFPDVEEVFIHINPYFEEDD
ncbi:MAG TPA: cation diffusion facilitator family transporter [Bacillales bacterium]|nr:cation diffusion facilitator family transporter [Bacillales bacterium]